mgnify:CR=1 FL=1
MKDNKILFGTFIALLLLLTTGLSYAYFSTSVKGNDNAKDVIVEAGTLKLTYTDGPAINAQYIKPGWSTTKEVSVKNNGTLDAYYNVIWQSLTNGITNDELVLSATCQRLNTSGTVEGTCDSISQAPISDMTIAKKISIESGITHKYTFTILFKDTNANQNYNQGKEFNGVLGIEEYKAPDFATDSWSTIIANVKAGKGREYVVGSTKEVNLGSSYGTHTLRVANTSTPSECSTAGFSQTACGFVLEFADIIATHKMNDTDTTLGGWPATLMRTFVNNDIYNAIPSEIKNAIIDTTVVSGHGKSDTENFTSTDKLYLLAPKEIYTDFNDSYDTAKDLTRTLDYYKVQGVTTSNYSGAIKKNGTSTDYWMLRTVNSYFTNRFYVVASNGDYGNGYAIGTVFVSPAFRLG